VPSWTSKNKYSINIQQIDQIDQICSKYIGNVKQICSKSIANIYIKYVANMEQIFGNDYSCAL